MFIDLWYCNNVPSIISEILSLNLREILLGLFFLFALLGPNALILIQRDSNLRGNIVIAT